MTEVVCRDGCKRTAVDEETAGRTGWRFLALQKNWRCPACERELHEANLEFSKEYYMNQEKKLDAEILGHMQRLDLKPGDKVVVTYPHMIVAESQEAMYEYLCKRLPGVDVIILDSGAKMGVLRQEHSGGSGI